MAVRYFLYEKKSISFSVTPCVTLRHLEIEGGHADAERQSFTTLACRMPDRPPGGRFFPRNRGCRAGSAGDLGRVLQPQPKPRRRSRDGGIQEALSRLGGPAHFTTARGHAHR